MDHIFNILSIITYLAYERDQPQDAWIFRPILQNIKKNDDLKLVDSWKDFDK